jgi:fructose-1,6-bisphosphatase/sedoheptulose 1,7-bisphosphatase-like protein
MVLHGSPASRLLRGSRSAEVCATVTIVDGLVLARSAMHHSMNYRSVVVLGRAEVVDDLGERRAALDAGYDLDRQLTADDLIRSDDCFFSATGVTDGDVLQGVRFHGDYATTESLVMRSRSGTVRRVHARHDRRKLRAMAGVRFG